MFVNYGCPRNSAIERWRYDLSHLHKIAMDCWPTMFRKMKALLVCLVLLMPVSAVAQDGDTQDGEDSVRNQALQEDLLKSGNNGGYSDPFAPVNERMLKFNLKLDDYVLRPVATGYASITSEPMRAGVGRFLDNIKVIPYVANNLFQLRFAEAGSDLAVSGSTAHSAWRDSSIPRLRGSVSGTTPMTSALRFATTAFRRGLT